MTELTKYFTFGVSLCLTLGLFVSSSHAQSDVWVDLTYPGYEQGSQSAPYDTLADALVDVSAGGTVHFTAGDSHEVMTINQSVIIDTTGGTVRLGILSSVYGSGAPLEWLRITEIMYNPGDGGAEYLELQNAGPIALDVSGVYFSDGIDYTFPGSTTLAAGELFVLVRDTDQAIYNSLYGDPGDGTYSGALSNNGETIAMSTPGGIEFFSLTYDNNGAWPDQANGQGWSLVILNPSGDTSDPSNWALSEFIDGSPGGSETNPTSPVADTEFSIDRGFYDTPFFLELSTETFGATIRYTLDGSTPDCGTGTVYGGPISINGTSIVRAIACKSGWISTNVDTATYLFLHDIVTQSSSPGGGWPNSGQYINDQIFNFGMDSAVINSPAYMDSIDDAFLSIATISIVTDLDNLIDPVIGIHVNAQEDGPDWERPTSIELINPEGNVADPNGTEGFQEDAGLRIRGGSSRGGWNPKHGFRLFFREEYGAGKLKYPLFGDEGVNEFDKFDLRMAQQGSWHQFADSRSIFNRDVFNRDTQRDLGQPYTRSRYYHLYLNGVYWGLVQSQERAEARYAESYFGGVKEDYDVIKGGVFDIGGTTDGNINAWHRLWAEATAGFGSDVDYYYVQGKDPDGTPNPANEKLVDLDNLMDYMLTLYYGGNLDSTPTWYADDIWSNNYYFIYNRVNPDGFKLFLHDNEHTLQTDDIHGQGPELYRDRTGPFPDGEAIWASNKWSANPQWNHLRLTAHPEYRMAFADRVHRHFFNDGALTPDAVDARFGTRVDEIFDAIIGESARWGDRWTSPARTRDDHWIPAIDQVRNDYFPYRTDIVVDQFRNLINHNPPWYPLTDAPVFYMNGGYQHGGYAGSPFSMSMVNPVNPNGTGTLYYTLDGTDPRVPGTNAVPTNGTLIVTEVASKMALVPTSAGDLDDSGTPWTDVGFNDNTWASGSGSPGGVGYDIGSGYTSLIGIDVRTEMYNVNGSALVRIPFILTGGELAGIGCLTLRVKYDDGFVAYINGTEVARANASGTPAWNSLASGNHDDAAAVIFQDFNIDAYIGALNTGENILAFHGLNRTLNSSDFLISVELEAYECSTDPPTIDPGAMTYSGAFALTGTTHVKSRVLDGGEWSAMNEATFVTNPFVNDLLITEIMYNPLNPAAEFIEIQNVGAQSINLINTAFTEGIHFAFPHMTLAVGARVLAVSDIAAFESVYGTGLPIVGEYDGALDNSGERIRLEDPTGATIADFEYKDSWYSITDGDGYSLTSASGDPVDWSTADGWRASALVGGTPGGHDNGQIPNPNAVLINEVLAHSDNEDPDWIELYNPTDDAANIGNWYLSDNKNNLMKYKIAGGTSIPAGGYVVFYQDTNFGNAGDPGSITPFALSESGETVYLSSGSGSQLTGYREQEDFGASATDIAFGRHMKSMGTFNFVSMNSNTPGSSNSTPKVGPIIIREFMYHPVTINEEYIELYNNSGSTVTLEDSGIPWRFTDGIDYIFPLGTTIPPWSFLVVAKDPTAFAAQYSPPGGVPILGPYAGALDNGGEKLELGMPGDVDNNGILQYIRIDRVVYDDTTPWPTTADGGGKALKRTGTSSYGNDVANWSAVNPSPGQ